MPNADDQHASRDIVNLVEHPMVTDPDPVRLDADDLLAARRPRRRAEPLDALEQPGLKVGCETGKVSTRAGS